MSDYKEFLVQKTILQKMEGLKSKPFHPMLFPFQKDIVDWALKLGRACVWADTGMGKTLMQVSWASQIPGDVLILAPLAVSHQTVKEAKKIGVTIRYCRDASEVRPGITITNYQMLFHFDCSRFKGVALDEGGILKNFSGAIRNQLIESFSKTAYRSSWTATPAPNDHMELGNQVEFLGLMTYVEMLSMFFVHDGGETSKWRLKGHAKKDFWKWVSSWAVMLRKPSDLGYEDDGFILPPLEVISKVVEHPTKKIGYRGLLPFEASTLPDRIIARRESVKERATAAAELVNSSPDEPWLLWCNLNKEADLIQKMIKGAVQVQGGETIDAKTTKLIGFSQSNPRVLVTKPSICGHGMNWQHCSKMIFVGLSDSWEQYYQAVRRCWRFGQKKKVTVYIITSAAEGAVLKNIQRKEDDANKMLNNILKNMNKFNRANLKKGQDKTEDTYKTDKAIGKEWKLYLGDCIESLPLVKTESVGLSVFSPPFASLYTYSASNRDLGNSKNKEEFSEHFRFVIRELFRVMQPGRNVSIHCMNLPMMKQRDGVIGLRDFRGEIIRDFGSAGFIFHSEVLIWKDPVLAMQRTKALGLLWKQLKKDSCMSRMGIPDTVVTMRKPGVNTRPVEHDPKEFPVALWQKWASPIWMDINPSDTLQYRSARENEDERHICPLQLEVIRRCVHLWSKPDDIILSPFAGIGSEGVVALECGRRFIGFELKESYWNQAKKNLLNAERRKGRTLLPSL